jgi:hypothetical protein
MAEVESVNESTAEIPSSEKLELAGGENPVSFDELETIHRYHDQKQKEGKASEKKAQTKDAEDKKESRTGQSNKAGDDDSAGKKESGTAQDEDSKEATADKEETKPPVKTLKAKAGDQELDLALNTLIPAKVAGKEVEVTLEDLRNNYAGKVAWSEEFSKLGTEKQKFTEEKTSLMNDLTEIFNLSQKDGVSALMKMAEFSGMNPLEWRQNFMNVLLPQLENYLSLDETERNAVESQFEKDYWKQQAESQRERQHQEQSFKQFESHVSQLQQTHQVNPDLFAKTFFELEKLQKAGQLNREITPEFVIEIVNAERVYDAVSEVFEELKLDLASDEKDKVFKDLSEIAERNPELTASDLKEIAREVWGKHKAQNLSRKIQKAKGEKSAQAPKRAMNPGHEPLTFDDL